MHHGRSIASRDCNCNFLVTFVSTLINIKYGHDSRLWKCVVTCTPSVSIRWVKVSSCSNLSATSVRTRLGKFFHLVEVSPLFFVFAVFLLLFLRVPHFSGVWQESGVWRNLTWSSPDKATTLFESSFLPLRYNFSSFQTGTTTLLLRPIHEN